MRCSTSGIHAVVSFSRWEKGRFVLCRKQNIRKDLKDLFDEVLASIHMCTVGAREYSIRYANTDP